MHQKVLRKLNPFLTVTLFGECSAPMLKKYRSNGEAANANEATSNLVLSELISYLKTKG